MKLSYGERKSTTQTAGSVAPPAGIQADAPNAAQSQASLTERLQTAIAHRKAGAYLAAFELLDALEKIEPQNPVVQLQLGSLWLDWANHPRARAHAERAVAIQPNFDEAWELLGRANLHAGNFPAAAEAYRRALECGPEIAGRRANLGLALMQAGAWSDAEKQLRRAIELDGQVIETRNNLGVTLAHLGQYDQSFAQFLQVSEPAAAWNNLGVVLRERKEWSEARAAFRRALALKPDYQKAQLNLAELNAYMPPASTVYLPAFPSQQSDRLAVRSNVQTAALAAPDSAATVDQTPAKPAMPAPRAIVAARTEGPGPLPAAVSIRWVEEQGGPVAAPKSVASGPETQPALTARVTEPAAISLAVEYDLTPRLSTSPRFYKPKILAHDFEPIAQEPSRNDGVRAMQTAIVASVHRRIDRITTLDLPDDSAYSSTHTALEASGPDFPSVVDNSIDRNFGPWAAKRAFGSTGIRSLDWQRALRPGAFRLGISLTDQRVSYDRGSVDTASPAWLGALAILVLFGLALAFFGLPLAAAVVCLGLLAWLGMASTAFF